MNEIKGNTRKERCEHQLNEWVKGNPVHNKTDDECCPDFSCCNPQALQPKEIRIVFVEVNKKADHEPFNPDHHPYEDARMGMLMGFLGNAVNKYTEKKVHITDGDMAIRKEKN